jgi:hypothetical protein
MNYLKKTVFELKNICREQKIKGFSGKNKKELIDLIQKNEVVSHSTQNTDTYTKELLKQQYALHQSYVKGRIETTIKIGIKVRLPSIPEDISENIIKQLIHNKLNDKTSRWNCKGDLLSEKEGKQECKCFTSDAPASFTPSSEWDIIYFLDARNWLNDTFILYQVPLKRTSNEWKNIKMSKTQTFEDQTKQGRRPRITWESLHPQIEPYCKKIYEGTFEDIFIQNEATEEVSPQSV